MKPRKWTKEDLEKAASQSKSVRQVLGFLGLAEAGGNYAQIKKYLEIYGIDISRFRGRAWNKGLKTGNFKTISLKNILVKDSNFQSFKLKKRLFSEGLKQPACEECGWNDKTVEGRLPLELHHKNGDSKDNRIENLQVLCPNCHSLKPNYRGLNIKN